MLRRVSPQKAQKSAGGTPRPRLCQTSAAMQHRPDRPAEDAGHHKARGGLHRALHAHEQQNEHQRVRRAQGGHKALDVIGTVEEQHQRAHEEHGVQHRTRQRGRAEGGVGPQGLVLAVQGLEDHRRQPARQHPGGHAGQEGEHRVDGHQRGAEGVGTEAGGKAGQAKDATQNGALGGPQQDGAHRHRDHDGGDGQRADVDVAQRGVGQHQHDGGQQRQPGQTQSLGMVVHVTCSFTAAPPQNADTAQTYLCTRPLRDGTPQKIFTFDFSAR